MDVRYRNTIRSLVAGTPLTGLSRHSWLRTFSELQAQMQSTSEWLHSLGLEKAEAALKKL